MAQQGAPSFSQAAIEALRHTPGFERWNRDFETLKRKIQNRLSPRDLQPLLKAGAEEDRILSLLAFIVYDSDGLSPKLLRRRRSLAMLADELEAVAARAALVVKDPLCDGRFWLALHGFLSWDQTTRAGVIEARCLSRCGPSLG
jgi:hypothetical protein